MADYTGALKFPDGTTLLFSLQGTTDTALRQLFTADEQVLHEQSAQFALRKQEAAVRIAQAFFANRKPVAAICPGPQTLITAGLLRGRRATCHHSVAEEMREAGALYQDSEVVVQI